MERGAEPPSFRSRSAGRHRVPSSIQGFAVKAPSPFPNPASFRGGFSEWVFPRHSVRAAGLACPLPALLSCCSRAFCGDARVCIPLLGLCQKVQQHELLILGRPLLTLLKSMLLYGICCCCSVATHLKVSMYVLTCTPLPNAQDGMPRRLGASLILGTNKPQLNQQWHG